MPIKMNPERQAFMDEELSRIVGIINGGKPITLTVKHKPTSVPYPEGYTEYSLDIGSKHPTRVLARITKDSTWASDRPWKLYIGGTAINCYARLAAAKERTGLTKWTNISPGSDEFI